MKLRNVLLLLFIFSAGSMAAQTDTFDLSSYKARFERRPAMSLAGQANFHGNYGMDQTAENAADMSGAFYWQELRNTDALISTWWLSGGLQGAFGQSGGSNNDSYNAGGMSVNSQWEQSHYYRPGRFRGFGGTLQSIGSLSSLNNNSQNLSIKLAPAVFMGRGRIEFAEDALLASWMIEDLEEAGVTGGHSSEDIAALARTITDIIGNRTFDFRRRRIYELERLQSTLRERGLAEEESFALFAILNDNWAFANRSSLPHGNRLTYGLEADAYSRWAHFNDFSSTQFYNYGLGFVEYTRARIINNNGGGQWAARLAGGYYYSLRKVNEENWQRGRDGVLAQARLSYTRLWLPSSRTTISWVNVASVTLGLTEALNPLSFTENEARWISLLNMDYFINYQWSFRLRASANFVYRGTPDQLGFVPNLNFSTYYYIF